MTKSIQSSSSFLKPLSVAVMLAMSSGAILADGKKSGLFQALADVNESSFMQNMGLKFGGWAAAGITYNATDPGDNFNGPVTFNDRASEFQLNQLNLFVERATNKEGSDWDLGGRFDFMFGTDSVLTQAYGSPRGHWDLHLMDSQRFYDIALPQAYVEVFAPFGNGISAKIGHFYTPIGNEVVTSPDNFFYSHAYTMQYGEPFTHTGVVLSYPFKGEDIGLPAGGNFTLLGGGVTGSITGGWDGGWDKGLGNWAYIGGMSWASDDAATSVTLTATSGTTSEQNNNNWSIYSFVLKHNITDSLHYTLQHDHGWANKVQGGRDAEWYGVNQYLTYDIQDDLSVGLRAEWFRDDDGFRVLAPAREPAYAGVGSSYYAATVGLNWKPLDWLKVRPEVRYDWADKAKAFDAGNAGDQFTFATDVVISFF